MALSLESINIAAIVSFSAIAFIVYNQVLVYVLCFYVFYLVWTQYLVINDKKLSIIKELSYTRLEFRWEIHEFSREVLEFRIIFLGLI